MNAGNGYGGSRGVPRVRLHLHSPTLDAVIEALYREDAVESVEEVIRLVDAMRPPMAYVTMGDLFGHVDVGEEQEQEGGGGGHDDSCEICGVRCASTRYAPFPGLCVRCTVKVQRVQALKQPQQTSPPRQQEGGGAR